LGRPAGPRRRLRHRGGVLAKRRHPPHVHAEGCLVNAYESAKPLPSRRKDARPSAAFERPESKQAWRWWPIVRDLGVQRGDDRDLAGGDRGVGGLQRRWLPQLLGAQQTRSCRARSWTCRRRARLSAAVIAAVLSRAAWAGSGARPSSSSASDASRSAKVCSAAGKVVLTSRARPKSAEPAATGTETARATRRKP
jgi:hypothetical protein